MLQVGKKAGSSDCKKVNFGVYLAEAMDASDKVLLPKKRGT